MHIEIPSKAATIVTTTLLLHFYTSESHSFGVLLTDLSPATFDMVCKSSG